MSDNWEHYLAGTNASVDPRLNALLPQALDLPGDQFIWLRNAGNIVTGPLSSTMRSLALACAVKGGREIVILGHTDCWVCKTTTMLLLEKLKELGVERHWLPENLNEFFGMFASERQNVINACEIVRHSPLIGANIPVQGFVMDIATGKLEWIVNSYQSLETTAGRLSERDEIPGHENRRRGDEAAKMWCRKRRSVKPSRPSLRLPSSKRRTKLRRRDHDSSLRCLVVSGG